MNVFCVLQRPPRLQPRDAHFRVTAVRWWRETNPVRTRHHLPRPRWAGGSGRLRQREQQQQDQHQQQQHQQCTARCTARCSRSSEKSSLLTKDFSEYRKNTFK
eukprot:COSAG02_NODE_669_length_18681_cov_170.310499_9_plen_103_part_00